MDDIRAVMDAVGSKRAAILGVSEGGPMTLLFAGTYPERTAAAILYGVGPSNVRAEDYPWAPTEEEWNQYVRREAQRAGTQEWVDERLEIFAPSMAKDEDARRWWRRWVRTSTSPAAVMALRQMNKEIDVRHTLSAIRVPTLVIHPVGDKVAMIEEGRYMAERIPGAQMVELDGVDHGWWVQRDPLARETERFLRGIWDRGEWDMVETDRVLATIMFTDIVGSTEKLAALGDRRWRELLQQHHAVVRRQLVRFRGRELDTAGDGFFASFDGPARAIRCALAISDSVRALGVDVRAGLHTGECEMAGGKVGGIAVHIGARVAALAGPGEVLVSSTVKDLVAGSGIRFQDRGPSQLKGVPDEWRLFAVERDPPGL
jgi:class 3 adenylate cyclase